MTLIALEGPDNGGKSTLAKHLVTLFDAKHGVGAAHVWHEGPPPEGVDLVAHYELPLIIARNEILDPHKLIILDRWETGELVYGPLLRGHSRLSVGQALHVDLLLHTYGALRVLVQPHLNTLYERYDTVGDDLIEREWLPELWAFYRAYAERHDWGCHVAAATESVAQYLLDKLILDSLEADGSAVDLAPFPGYVGWVQPEVLLVGERRGNFPNRPNDGTGAWGWGAFTPSGEGGSSKWLLDTLERLPVLPNVGLANAFEHDQDFLALWRALKQPAVVALGNESSQELTRLGIQHEKVPHPSWSRRFRRKFPHEYETELGEGIIRALDRNRDGGSGVPGPAVAGGAEGTPVESA